MTATIPRYARGNVVVVSLTFDDVDGAYDPDDVVVTVVRDDTVVNTYQHSTQGTIVVKDGVGRYHVNVAADPGGFWRVRAVATGAKPAAVVTEWIVPADGFS